MKLMKRLLQLSLPLLVAVPNIGIADESDGGLLGNIKIQRCTSSGSKCLSLNAAKGETGTLSSVMAFEKGRLEVTDATGKVLVNRLAAKGYLDLANEQLVVLERKGPTLTETVIELNGITEKKYVHR